MKTLRQVREDKGVKKSAIAKCINVSTRTYSRYERCPEKIRIKDAIKIANFLSVDISEIFFGMNSK